MHRTTTVLFPTDMSPESEQGLAFATSFARDLGGRLVLLHVEDAAETFEGEYYGPSEVLRSELWQKLHQLLPPDDTVPCLHRYEVGATVRTICAVAAAEQVDFIVMPTHGRRGLSHWLLGSVTEAVIQRAPCPVVTLRPSVAPGELVARHPLRLRPLRRDEVRRIDACATTDFGMPSATLMENAGRGAADLLERMGIDGPVLVVAGRGNNGGDGYVLARHLDYRGYEVRVLLLGKAENLGGDARQNWEIALKAGIPCQALGEEPDLDRLKWAIRQSTWVVDGLLGTGAQGALRPPLPAVIDCVNEHARMTLALDLPSGLDCDTGETLGACIRARDTVTFVSRKCGFDAPGAAEYLGHVHVVPIGVPRVMLEPFQVGTP